MQAKVQASFRPTSGITATSVEELNKLKGKQVFIAIFDGRRLSFMACSNLHDIAVHGKHHVELSNITDNSELAVAYVKVMDPEELPHSLESKSDCVITIYDNWDLKVFDSLMACTRHIEDTIVTYGPMSIDEDGGLSKFSVLIGKEISPNYRDLLVKKIKQTKAGACLWNDFQ